MPAHVGAAGEPGGATPAFAAVGQESSGQVGAFQLYTPNPAIDGQQSDDAAAGGVMGGSAGAGIAVLDGPSASQSAIIGAAGPPDEPGSPSAPASPLSAAAAVGDSHVGLSLSPVAASHPDASAINGMRERCDSNVSAVSAASGISGFFSRGDPSHKELQASAVTTVVGKAPPLHPGPPAAGHGSLVLPPAPGAIARSQSGDSVDGYGSGGGGGSRPCSPSPSTRAGRSGSASVSPATTISVRSLASYVDKRVHGDDVLQIAAAAGSADVVRLFLDGGE